MVQESFQQNGYAVFEKALDDAELHTLRQTCDTLLDEPVHDGGTGGTHKIGMGQARRFLAHRHKEFPELQDLILGPKMARLGRDLLGATPYLFNEQFVVKGAQTGARFAWHQDSAYVGFDHAPYLTVWMALDDAKLDNGCIRLRKRNLKAEPGIDPHVWEDETNELNGYFGDDPGIPLPCPAGTIVAFSSLTLHTSGPNKTDAPRRAYIAQYSAEPIIDPDTGKPKRFATQLQHQ